MKLQYPSDAPFAVDVPDLDREGIEPGGVVDVEDPTVAASLLAQGWLPADKPAKDAARSRDDKDATNEDGDR